MTSPEDAVDEVMAQVPPQLLDRSRQGSERFVIAIAGPPAAGKSTVAAGLIERFEGQAGLFGLDAYHFDDAVLEARGHRERKGAPHTFDVHSYGLMLEALRRGGVSHAVPVFDRSLELSRNCAAVIEADQPIVVTEGNYLLLNRQPWASLRPLFDLTVWIEVGAGTVEERIRTRWLKAGLPTEEIERRTGGNDLPNYRTVRNESGPADLVISNGPG